uniref:Uncharacterized protein n=1 Tax=Fundulus heteroclitus TaxID=8078 RepID=A0A3Q2QWU8_FUNHE
MSSGRLQVRIKRVCSRKRSRDVQKTHLTPVRKQGRGGGGSPPRPPCRRSSSVMAEPPAVEYCSDGEDLFGDYDSILEDSSILAKLDDADQHERLRSEKLQSFGTPQPSEGRVSQSPEGCVAGPAADELEVNALEDLPPSQLQFQEQIQGRAKKSRLQVRNQISTPSHSVGEITEAAGGADSDDADQRPSKATRRVSDLLKRTMLHNAASPVGVSRITVLKEAVVSEEISVAMQAMETISAETTDLGPFFGLPSKVKELMHKLRGIQSLYGENTTHQKKPCAETHAAVTVPGCDPDGFGHVVENLCCCFFPECCC